MHLPRAWWRFASVLLNNSGCGGEPLVNLVSVSVSGRLPCSAYMTVLGARLSSHDQRGLSEPPHGLGLTLTDVSPNG